MTAEELDRWMRAPLGPHVEGGAKIKVSVESTGKTGVEMEAMAGVVGAALTVVDMCKGVDKHLVIGDVKVVGKKGGRSGSWGVFGKESKEDTIREEWKERVEKRVAEEGGTSREKGQMDADMVSAERVGELEMKGTTKEEKEGKFLNDSSGGLEVMSRRVFTDQRMGVEMRKVQMEGKGEEESQRPSEKEEERERVIESAREQARILHVSNKESGKLRLPDGERGLGVRVRVVEAKPKAQRAKEVKGMRSEYNRDGRRERRGSKR